MTGILIKRPCGVPEIHAEGRWPSKDGGRNWNDTSISQGTPRFAGTHRKLRRGEE